EVRGSRDTLRHWGLDPRVWVAPGGTGYANWWSQLRETVARYYPFAVMPNGWNNANPAVGIDSVDAFRIGTYPPAPNLGWSVESVKAELATKLGRHEWVVLKFHGTPDTVITKILEVVDWLVANDIKILKLEDAAALWFCSAFDLPDDLFTDPEFKRDIDANGIPDNCLSVGSGNYLETYGRFGTDPLGGIRYFVIDGSPCQFALGGVSRGRSYSISFWAKAVSPGGAVVDCRVYQEKHGWVPANSGQGTRLAFTLPDDSWYRVDSLLAAECNFTANDSTEILRAVFSSGQGIDKTVCIAKPSVRLIPEEGTVTRSGLAYRCWPNPTRQEVTFEYHLPAQASVTLTILDVLGRVVNVLDEGRKSPGPHAAVWNMTSRSGAAISPGVYVSVLEVDGRRQTKKIAVVR
ncbi:MAG: T9SS type A sorting domain-containing protein, partial [Candidatus Eiseniibacteriota bacterium]